MESGYTRSLSPLATQEYGWKISDSELRIDWDDATNMEQVRKAVQLLLKGCSCKKGCKTRRCGCLKDGRKCGPGCSCSNCENSLTGTAPTAREEIDDEVETEEMQEDQALRDQYASYLVDDNECDEVTCLMNLTMMMAIQMSAKLYLSECVNSEGRAGK